MREGEREESEGKERENAEGWGDKVRLGRGERERGVKR